LETQVCMLAQFSKASKSIEESILPWDKKGNKVPALLLLDVHGSMHGNLINI
jgi:hypothetical protein